MAEGEPEAGATSQRLGSTYRRAGKALCFAFLLLEGPQAGVD